MNAAQAATIVDVRGMLGPWLAVRLSRAARTLGGPGLIQVLADDPAALTELETLCAERGWTILPGEGKEYAFDVRIG